MPIFLSTSLRIRTQRRACAALGSHACRRAPPAGEAAARQGILAEASILVLSPLVGADFFVHVTADPNPVAWLRTRLGSHACRRAPPAGEAAARQSILAEVSILVLAHPCGGRLFCPCHCGSEPGRVRSHAIRFACLPQSAARRRGGGKAGHTRGGEYSSACPPLRWSSFLSVPLRIRTRSRAKPDLASKFARVRLDKTEILR